MKLGELYELVIKRGLENDPRSPREIQDELRARRREYNKLRARDKSAYDKENLKHPYTDTRILHGDAHLDVRTVMVGIDMEGPELLAADRLNERGRGIDLVIAHHPEGMAWAGFTNVMYMQQDILKKFGIPLCVGKDLLKERIGEVERALSPSNHARSVDIARLLDIPFMCMHTPADNHVTTYLQRLFDKKRRKTLGHVLEVLKGIPEYRDAMAKHAGPKILIGEPKNDAGKVFVDMTGGTEGSKKVFARLSQAGVGTIIAMHLSETHYKIAKDEHINVVIAGHISSDALGLNLLLDSVTKREPLTIIPCSGFVRVRR
jgi:hypothetical protein